MRTPLADRAWQRRTVAVSRAPGGQLVVELPEGGTERHPDLAAIAAAMQEHDRRARRDGTRVRTTVRWKEQGAWLAS